MPPAYGAVQGSYKQVTCEVCKVAVALTEGDTAAAEPTEYARRTQIVHAWVHDRQGGAPCGRSMGVHGYFSIIFARVQEGGDVASKVTCRVCLKVLRERGWPHCGGEEKL